MLVYSFKHQHNFWNVETKTNHLLGFRTACVFHPTDWFNGLKFNGPVNSVKGMSSRSVYLLTFLG